MLSGLYFAANKKKGTFAAAAQQRPCLSPWERWQPERADGEGNPQQSRWMVNTMSIPKNNKLLNNARKLRLEMTEQERRLWYQFLRNYPVKIYKQRIIGQYIVDFYCASAKLVIEIDGSQHYEENGVAYDARRTSYLNNLGLQVIRFSNADINLQFRNVCESIHQTIHARLNQC